MSGDPQPETIPAATVVIFRNDPAGGPPQLLMVTRSRNMSFAGGMAVFPGGRIDPADRDLAPRIAPQLDETQGAAMIAAMRETLEETGLVIAVKEAVSAAEAADARAMLLETVALAPVLDRFGWTLDLSRLVYFARWWPRFRHERSFDTHFYLYDIGTGAVDIAVDATENTRLFWTSAADALAAADRGEIAVIFPTRRNLERLATFADFRAAKAHAEATPVRTITPQIEDREGGRVLTIPGDLGYPVTEEEIGSAMRG